MIKLCFILIFSCISISSLSAQDTLYKYTDQKTLQSYHIIAQNNGNNYYHGKFETYHLNGAVQSNGAYSLGQLNGWYSEFNTSGNILVKMRYTNGILNGESFTYYTSGNIKERKLYINGKIHGEHRKYLDQENSPIEIVAVYNMGAKK